MCKRDVIVIKLPKKLRYLLYPRCFERVIPLEFTGKTMHYYFLVATKNILNQEEYNKLNKEKESIE